MTEKIGSFKSALKGLSIEDVINRIINLQEVEKNDEPLKGKWAGMEHSELDQCNQKKILYRRNLITDLFDKLLEQPLDLLCDQFIVLALHLEFHYVSPTSSGIRGLDECGAVHIQMWSQAI